MSDINKGPMSGELNESDVDPDPFKQFACWYNRALAANLFLPDAMTLATATRDGRASARMVLLKGVDETGFVFYTNYESPKATEIQQNPYAALVLYWAQLGRQIRITGSVSKVSREESEAYFSTRPRDSQLGAWVSRQSEVIGGRLQLENELVRLEAFYKDRQIPIPPYWGGFRLAPDALEFWQSRPGRLHDRLLYRKGKDGKWVIERLSP